jgi:hypothetical protein
MVPSIWTPTPVAWPPYPPSREASHASPGSHKVPVIPIVARISAIPANSTATSLDGHSPSLDPAMAQPGRVLSPGGARYGSPLQHFLKHLEGRQLGLPLAGIAVFAVLAGDLVVPRPEPPPEDDDAHPLEAQVRVAPGRESPLAGEEGRWVHQCLMLTQRTVSVRPPARPPVPAPTARGPRAVGGRGPGCNSADLRPQEPLHQAGQEALGALGGTLPCERGAPAPAALHTRHEREEHARAGRKAPDGGVEHCATVDDAAEGLPGDRREHHVARDGAAAVPGLWTRLGPS